MNNKYPLFLSTRPEDGHTVAFFEQHSARALAAFCESSSSRPLPQPVQPPSSWYLEVLIEFLPFVRTSLVGRAAINLLPLILLDEMVSSP